MQMVNKFKIVLLSRKPKKHFMVYFVDEVFLSLITLGLRSKKFSLNSRVKKVYQGLIFQITKRTILGEETIIN